MHFICGQGTFFSFGMWSETMVEMNNGRAGQYDSIYTVYHSRNVSTFKHFAIHALYFGSSTFHMGGGIRPMWAMLEITKPDCSMAVSIYIVFCINVMQDLDFSGM